MTTTDEIAEKLDGLIRKIERMEKTQDRLFSSVHKALDDTVLRYAINDLDKDVMNGMKVISLLATNTSALRDALRKQDASPKPDRGQEPAPGA